MIAECRNLAMLRKSLATLPQTLDQTYDRILTAISEKDRMYTIRILQWLTFSARPLSLEEVAEVIAIDVARDLAFDRDEVLVEPLEALEICSSLVTIVKEEPTRRSEHGRQIVILAHYSVQEYLVSDRIRQGPAKQYSMKEIECHKAMTIGCLGYLNQFQEPLTDEIYYASALADYSANFWSDHLQKTEDQEEEMSQLVMRLLFTNDSAFANCIRIFDPDTGELYEDRTGDQEIITPLYYASSLGLKTVTKLLLDQNVDVNAVCGIDGSALWAAVKCSRLEVAELLVNAKADVNVSDWEGFMPLPVAIRQSDTAIAKVLISAGADVNVRDQGFSSPLEEASTIGDETLVKMLIDRNAEINNEDGDVLFNALWRALDEKHDAIVKLLVDAGAAVNIRDGDDYTPLQTAACCSSGNEKVVRRLIEAGADVNAYGNDFIGNALFAAAERGNTAVVELLLNEGADINALHAKLGSALHGAVRASKEATAELLLRRGASVALDMQSKGVLNNAIDSPDCTVALVRTLQQYRVPLDTIDVDNMAPLHYCAKFEHEAIAAYLLDAGVDIDSRVRRRAWPNRGGDSGESQADPTFTASKSTAVGLTSLHFAALKGKAKMTRFLLEHGADPNARSVYGETPLHLALRATTLGEKCKFVYGKYGCGGEWTKGEWGRDEWDKVKLLEEVTPQAREEVVDALLGDTRTCVTAVDNDGESCLHSIRYGKQGSATLVHKLISKQADPCLVNSSQKSPLCLALQAKDPESVKTLLSMGANATLTDEDRVKALHYAGHIKDHDLLVALLQSERENEVELIRSKDENGRNLLHHMFWAEWDQLKLTQWLLSGIYGGGASADLKTFPLAQYVENPTWVLNARHWSSILDTKECASFFVHEAQSLGHLCAKRFDIGVFILKILHKRGVDLTKKDPGGRTALHHAVLYNSRNEQVLSYLVDVVGIKAGDHDAQGRTALQYAIEKADIFRHHNMYIVEPWKRIVSMLSELQGRERPPLILQPGSSEENLETSCPLKPDGTQMH